MEDNPYNKLLDIMGSSASGMMTAGYRIGTVVSDKPLLADVGGAVQGNLVIAEYPLPVTVFEEGIHQHESSVGIALGGGHIHEAVTEPPEYGIGDKLLLIPIEEEQRYIVIARLVGL